jgi:polyketide biosynthesis enoyl-CoA hydratase PksH
VSSFQTITLSESAPARTLTLNRPQQRNAITAEMLCELHAALDVVVSDSHNRVLLIEGAPSVFCTGMDMAAMASRFDAPPAQDDTPTFMSLLKRIATMPRSVVAVVDGQVLAGGVGLAAACDLVIASPRARFALSEALWGLLPAQVMPYLVRRVGYQVAHAMTLSTTPVDAAEALQTRLVDELAEDLPAAVRTRLRRLVRLHPQTIADLKAYMRKMWFLNEQIEQLATSEFERLIQEPRIQANIRNFAEHGQLPWDA